MLTMPLHRSNTHESTVATVEQANKINADIKWVGLTAEERDLILTTANRLGSSYMIKWLKKLRRIVDAYSADQLAMYSRIAELEALVRERTNIAVDVGFRECSHVIVIGRYKGADYIQSYSLQSSDLNHLVDQLKQMERFGNVRRIDSPPQFRAAFARNV